MVLDAYLWLSNKFNSLCIEYELCWILREKVAQKIKEILQTTTKSKQLFRDD